MKENRKADLETLRAARPYLRSGLAFIVWLVRRDIPLEEAPEWADSFLDTLEQDLEKDVSRG